MKELVRGRAGEAEMTAAAVGTGTRLLREDAVDKVRLGLTTVEEVLRVIRIDDDEGGSAPKGPRRLTQ